MAQRVDLYSILVSYAKKNNSPYIDIEPFLDFLGRYAKKHSEEQPEWLKWVNDRNVKFWAEISALAEEGRCELIADKDDGRVYMPHFYLDVLDNAYKNADEDADIPFPCEESLKIVLPENQIRELSCEYDLAVYLEDPQNSDIPILKIRFPEDYGSALAPASKIPKQLSEMAMLKIRNYLRRSGNKEYAVRKLAVQLQGKESFIHDQTDRILLRPLDCFNDLSDGMELSYIFWSHFCILIKNDIKKKTERLSEDIAAIQAVWIIEALNGYYRTLALKQRDIETALLNLEAHLAKPPFLFTLEDIMKFTDSKGALLLNLYKNEGLEAWLKKKITESENNKLPALLVMNGPNKERYFLLKSKMLPLCFKLFGEARAKVREGLLKHWRKLLIDHRSESAMENDGDFEKALVMITRKLCPVLSELLEDPKLLLIYEEAEGLGVPAAAQIFNKGKLLPYSSLLFIKRKEILSEAKTVLPLWHSIPIISAIIVFFKKLSKKKKAESAESAEHDNPDEQDIALDIGAAAEELKKALIPPGYDLAGYLEELENRWSRLLDKKARENLILDVRSLISDTLRRTLRLRKKFTPTQETISQMAKNIVMNNQALSSLGGRESLILYCELYLLKLLGNIK